MHTTLTVPSSPRYNPLLLLLLFLLLFLRGTYLEDGEQGKAGEQTAQRHDKQHEGRHAARLLPLLTWGGTREKKVTGIHRIGGSARSLFLEG